MFPIGTLVHHRHLNPATVYIVIGKATPQSALIQVKYQSGPRTFMETEPEMMNGWGAGPDNLVKAWPLRLMLPEGV